MKKGKKAALIAVCAVLFLVACGGKTDAGVASEEIVVPEMSSEDLLVTSLEYLLEEKEGDTEKETVEQQEEAEEPDADNAGGQEEEAELVTAALVYYGASEPKEEYIPVEEITPEMLISELAKHNIVSLDTKVLSLQEQEEDGMEVLYLDLSKAFREYLLTMSYEAECHIMASVACTFLSSYDARAMYILVEGEPLVTSHAEYTREIYDYTPGEMHRFMIAEDEEASDSDETQSKLPLIQEKE